MHSTTGAVGFAFGTNGWNLTVAASRSNGYSNGWGTTYWNSELATGGKLSMDSGRHTVLDGAKASGLSVSALVGSLGSGNLSITSPMDEDHYVAKEQSYGINASIPLPGSTGAPSLGLSASQLNLLANYEAVREQSAINAGTGGFNITVNGNTHLRGGAITAEGPAAIAASRLVTQTLTHETLQNKDVVQGSSWSVSLAVGNTNEKGWSLGASSAGYARINTNNTSSTPSAVAGNVTLTRADLQAAHLVAQRAGEREPFEIKRADAQRRLNDLLANEPPTCDNCVVQTPGTMEGGQPGVLGARADVSGLAVGGGVAGLAGQPVSNSAPASADGAAAQMVGGNNSRWMAWNAAVRATQAEISKLDGRLALINAKTYGDASTLSHAPSDLHQPLLQTFDKSKVTQELKDGVAVTSAFGKAAFKAAGDYAGAQQAAAQAACGGITVPCPEADKWKDGGVYRATLHAVVGGLSFGGAGAVTNFTAEMASNSIKAVLTQAGFAEGTLAYNTLMAGAKTMIGSGVAGTAGAAAAFNADANNRQLHHWQYKLMKQSCIGEATASLDCIRLRAIEGVRSDFPSMLAGVPGTQISRNYDASGNVVGATLFDALTGQPTIVMDKADYDKIISAPSYGRSALLLSSMAVPNLRGLSCNDVSLTCEARGGATRSELDDLFRMGQGRYTVFTMVQILI